MVLKGPSTSPSTTTVTYSEGKGSSKFPCYLLQGKCNYYPSPDCAQMCLLTSLTRPRAILQRRSLPTSVQQLANCTLVPYKKTRVYVSLVSAHSPHIHRSKHPTIKPHYQSHCFCRGDTDNLYTTTAEPSTDTSTDYSLPQKPVVE